MTDIRSGPAQEAKRGLARRGIATVWVRAESEDSALRRGREVIKGRQYGRTGELTMFREETTHVEADAPVEPVDGIAAAYTRMKTEALRRADGLFELWFPAARC